ncbi:MAG: signal peptidase I [Bacilli bacterium]
MKFIREIIPYIIVIILVVLIRSFVVTPIKVDGTSMTPTLNDGEIMLLNKIDHNYKRFDIIVVKYNDTRLIKRIIGLPGEHIKFIDNKLYVDNKVIEDVDLDVKTADFDLNELNYSVVPDDCYFVLGDNRNNSTDSRIIGPIEKSNIIGKTNLVLFPFNKFGRVK